MEFDYLLRHSDYSSKKEVVLLAIYYQEEYNEQRGTSSTEIAGIIERSREEVPSKHISTYLRRLQDEGLVTTTNGDYLLHHSGQDHVVGLVDSKLVDKRREGLFIDTDIIDEHFYKRLVEDINECYKSKVNDAVLVLTRKLFENLLVDILRGHYGKQNIEIYFDARYGYHHGLQRLKKNFRDNLDEFRIYSRDIDKETIDDLDTFKEHGDAGAHSIVVGVSDEDIEEMAEEATNLTEILYDLWRGVRIANDYSKDE